MIDATGENKLTSIIENIKKAGSTVLVSGLPDWGIELFKKRGLYEKTGASSFFPDETSARESVFRRQETAD